MNIAFIGVGTNLGRKEQNCLEAFRLIEEGSAGKILKKSSLYHTQPYGVENQGWFLNAALKLETSLSVHELFLSLKAIERKMGRAPGLRWGPRIIDLDLLFYNSVIMETDGLTLPHPGISFRRFVLEPLAEIEEDLVHPVLHKTISTLYKDLLTAQSVEVLAA